MIRTLPHAPRLPLLLIALLLFAAQAIAASSLLDSLTSKDASGGLRAALSQGIDTAVTQLGATNGFLNDPKVAIPLPPALQKADRALRMVGMGKDADTLKAAMNHAAESAVANAKPVFKQALQKMSVDDAKGILTGAEDAGTQYFRKATSDQLMAQFKPIIARETAKLNIASLYDRYAGKAAGLGLIPAQDANLNDYVTNKALDGLFSRIGDEERAIRKDPMGQASSLIKKVFSAAK
ncbi:MAG: DUF4197 domain-containing protein [Gammaproteobacteria bacterium]